MKKIFSILLCALCCQAGSMAQTDDNALRINFTGTGCPIENEHLLEGTHITFSDDGEQMNLTVNNATATYCLDNVSGMTHFIGTPSVALRANQDPDNAGNYYTTFYSSLEAYTLPTGVKAYTASVNADEILLTPIVGDVLPQGEAVLLYSDVSGNIEMAMADSDGDGGADGDNQFGGVDVQTAQSDYMPSSTYYMLSYGQSQLGFYRMGSSMKLSANKAFLPMPASSPAPALRMVFAEEEEETGIDNLRYENENEDENDNIFSPTGFRISQPQQGVNIVNGKKVIITNH